jgi:mannan endo-1,4-beta-mannosidase
VFGGLDWLLAQAAARGLRLLLVLTNYWKDYGGMRQYVAWAAQQLGTQV